jgi:hypothetical protein
VSAVSEKQSGKLPDFEPTSTPVINHSGTPGDNMIRSIDPLATDSDKKEKTRKYLAELVPLLSL